MLIRGSRLELQPPLGIKDSYGPELVDRNYTPEHVQIERLQVKIIREVQQPRLDLQKMAALRQMIGQLYNKITV